jgi:hypothetical protein
VFVGLLGVAAASGNALLSGLALIAIGALILPSAPAMGEVHARLSWAPFTREVALTWAWRLIAAAVIVAGILRIVSN